MPLLVYCTWLYTRVLRHSISNLRRRNSRSFTIRQRGLEYHCESDMSFKTKGDLKLRLQEKHICFQLDTGSCLFSPFTFYFKQQSGKYGFWQDKKQKSNQYWTCLHFLHKQRYAEFLDLKFIPCPALLELQYISVHSTVHISWLQYTTLTLQHASADSSVTRYGWGKVHNFPSSLAPD